MVVVIWNLDLLIDRGEYGEHKDVGLVEISKFLAMQDDLFR